MNSRPKKIAAGEYEYKGRMIYRADGRRGAYNPWKISLVRGSFATLAGAVKSIDARTEAK